MKRIEKLRLRTLEDGIYNCEFHLLFFKSYEALTDLPESERYAESFYAAFEGLTPVISDGELIVGSRDVPLSPEAQKEWDEVYREINEKRSIEAGLGQDSHMAIDYDLVLSQGLRGIIRKIDGYLESCEEEKKAFYRTCRRCLEAVIRHSENYAAEAERQSLLTDDPIRKAELERLAAVCRKVPAEPAESFYEAVQSVHFITYCVTLNPFRNGTWQFQQFQLGRPDRYLWPYYQADMAKGTLTREEAQLLLDCLAIQINMRVPNGYSSGYMVGGTDKNGNVVANDLTEMCLQVIRDIRLVYPSVGFCWTKDMPDAMTEKACEILLHGHSHPAIFNDDLITEGLRQVGLSEEEVHDYIHSTCVEITPVASSNAWVASPYTNMPQLLLDVMDREYPDFDALLAAVFENLDTHIRDNYNSENWHRGYRAKHSVNPLLSCFVNDCLALGTDIEQGGARYNWIMPSFVGMANLVDALYVIKTMIFDEKKMTLCQYKEILDSDFAGNEALRQHVLNDIPKYGNDIDDVDRYFGMFTDHLVSECKKYKAMHQNGDLIPSVFCWIMHERFGRETGATPDGRRACFPLGDGSGPCQGREMNGPTASVLSATKWDHTGLLGGVAVNMKFARSSLGPTSLATVKSILTAYLKRGGFEMQINVIDNETLKKARVCPEQYRDLVVRIGGYSDYFVRLTPQMQEEVILRTEHRA